MNSEVRTAERGCIEVAMVGRAPYVGGNDQIAIVVGAIDTRTTSEGTVAALRDADGKASGEAGDAADGPSVCESFGQHRRKLAKRKRVGVAGYKVVRDVEGGEATAQLEIVEVQIGS